MHLEASHGCPPEAWAAAGPSGRLCFGYTQEAQIPEPHAQRRIEDPKSGTTREDTIAVEEPLEIRVAGDPVAVTMRSPGEDGDLALGFLFAEGIIDSADDVGSVAHCGRPGEEGFGNVIEVTSAPGVALALDRVEATRRGTLTTAACGVCGRRTIADLLTACAPVADGPTVRLSVVTGAVRGLSQAQRVFARTGGTHAAAAYAGDGTLLVAREDVGRHNAVDKVVGALLRDGRAGRAAGDGRAIVLVVSGRTSFEVVQKAARAAIPVVASVSAPTTLAIDLAVAMNLTLAGFVRGDAANLYAHPDRIRR